MNLHCLFRACFGAESTIKCNGLFREAEGLFRPDGPGGPGLTDTTGALGLYRGKVLRFRGKLIHFPRKDGREMQTEWP